MEGYNFPALQVYSGDRQVREAAPHVQGSPGSFPLSAPTLSCGPPAHAPETPAHPPASRPQTGKEEEEGQWRKATGGQQGSLRNLTPRLEFASPLAELCDMVTPAAR